ncbi:ABC transporter permease subunit [Tessaracoccus sp. ZS01]|uniref:ABC transporter permease n=1 Tax=Tessaracoccus sp. ZS01 TaxID=1906324 RepID=UPI000970019E|nr:ABC transporter permease subunit [Tessaracoccus sp. ZS01]MCG6567599.1 ABC transporter permease [Tessaracoccus sp. ZS01]OMG55954.1 ABC transporter permease [Tessaracoccus sp. ZS01]
MFQTAAGVTAPRSRVARQVRDAAVTLPFFGYLVIFLFLPTIIVIIGAFRNRAGEFTLDGVAKLFTPATVQIFTTTAWLALASALIGAVVGGVAAYALATVPTTSPLHRVYTAVSSVLAQFGGVMLAFAFISVLGKNGNFTRLMAGSFGVTLPGDFLTSIPGLIVVYCYFQIPLMIIVFLPAVAGLRQEWRDATENLGGSGWTFWTRVAGPILAPSFLGSFLLLFANAFSAYATAAALISQKTIIVPMAIEGAIRNENNTDMDSYAQALAAGMIVVIAVVMGLYALLQKRTARWTR